MQGTAVEKLRLFRFLLFGTAQQGTHPCQQLQHAEGLGHIVVCAPIQSCYLVVFLVLRRQHQHRELFPCIVCTNFTDCFQSVHSRQHQIKNRQLGSLYFKCAKCFLRSFKCRSLIAGTVQRHLNQISDIFIVLYNIDHSGFSFSICMIPAAHVVYDVLNSVISAPFDKLCQVSV